MNLRTCKSIHVIFTCGFLAESGFGDVVIGNRLSVQLIITSPIALHDSPVERSHIVIPHGTIDGRG